MHKIIILKRSLFCGIIWLLGSLQYFMNSNTSNVFFLFPLIIGIIQCILSFNYYKKYSIILKMILIIQTIYYLVWLGYVIMIITDFSIKIFGILLSICMLVITISTTYTIWKYNT